jgi:Flp pilus assembly pilin Flp
MRHALCSFLRDETAVTAIEHALLGAPIAVAIVASVTQLGSNLAKLHSHPGHSSVNARGAGSAGSSSSQS